MMFLVAVFRLQAILAGIRWAETHLHIRSFVSNILNTRESGSSHFTNTKKRAENMTCRSSQMCTVSLYKTTSI